MKKGQTVDVDIDTIKSKYIFDPFQLGGSATVPFTCRRLPHAKVVWVHPLWEIYNKYEYIQDKQSFLTYVLNTFAVVSDLSLISDNISVVDIPSILYADRYGGTNGAHHGGSGRSGGLGYYNAKGIGRTPLVAPNVDRQHSNGFLSLREAIKEVIFSELSKEHLPFGTVPIIAIIDCGFSYVFNKETGFEPCAIVIRPNIIRPAHFERATFFGDAGTPSSAQYIDANRVREAVQIAIGYHESDFLPESMFKKLAEQCGAARSLRLWPGRLLSSNVTISGAFLDFGSYRSVPSWKRHIGLTGEVFGTEIDQLIKAYLSVAFFFSKFSNKELEYVDTSSFCRELRHIENHSFLNKCFERLGAKTQEEKKMLGPLLENLYRIEQQKRVGDDEPYSSEIFSQLSLILLGQIDKKIVDNTINDLVAAIVNLDASKSAVTVERSLSFFDPRPRLRHAEIDREVMEFVRCHHNYDDRCAIITDFISDFVVANSIRSFL